MQNILSETESPDERPETRELRSNKKRCFVETKGKRTTEPIWRQTDFEKETKIMDRSDRQTRADRHRQIDTDRKTQTDRRTLCPATRSDE